MMVINRFKIPKTHKDHLDMSAKMKRHFINFVIREANRRGKVIHSTTAIEVTFRNKWNRGEIGRRLLTLAEGEEYTDVEMSFTFNSTDEVELNVNDISTSVYSSPSAKVNNLRPISPCTIPFDF